MNETADIEIRRCVLRVVRRGGWCWGTEGLALAKSASQKLPKLLANRLRARRSGVRNIEIAQPVRLNVRLRRLEWAALCRGTTLSADEETLIGSKLDAAIIAAFESLGIADGDSLVEGVNARPNQLSRGESEGLPTINDLSEPLPARSSLLKLLTKWRTVGVLEQRLCLLPVEVIGLWVERLIAASGGESPRRVPVTVEALAAIQREIDATRLVGVAATTGALVRRLIFALRVSQIASLGSADLRRQLVERWPVATPIGAETRADNPSVGSVSELQAALSDPGLAPNRHEYTTVASAAISRSSSSEFEMEVPCALPFLLLGPLARTGYLDTLAAVCDAAGIGGSCGAFAVGLARKVLAPPARGWLRTEAQQVAATALAGIRAPLPESQIAAVGRALREQLPVLNKCIGENLIRGHRPQAAWLLSAGGGGDDRRLLIDEDGLAVVGYGERGALLALACPSGSPLFVGIDGTDSDFNALDELQIPYVTSRNLSARRSARSFVSRDGRRSWISTHGEQQGRRRDLAARGPELVERANRAWRACSAERPAVRAEVDETFDRALGLAANFALGALAWSLWREREATDSTLALERFASLDARVRVGSGAVYVGLPLGRRFWDLRDHGFLCDVHDVPWLGGRVVTFGAG